MIDNLNRFFSDPKLLPLSRQELIRRIADRSAVLGQPAYLVGGFVRDALLNRPVNDFDIVIEGDAIKLGKLLVKEYGGKLIPHTAFKTATWHTKLASNGFLDLITARSEAYEHPGALPTVRASTIEDDLRRRDFTINAMAMRLEGIHFGELVDPLNGRDDLKNGVIRVLHPRSFIDDPTRMLRAVRYEERYSFQIEVETRKLINQEARAVLSQLSGERLRHEFDLMFGEENLESMLARSADLELMNAVHPALPWDDVVRERFSRLTETPARTHVLWAVWLMGLSQPEIRSLGKRLHFTAETLKCALAASTIFHQLDSFGEFRPSQCVEQLEKMPDDAVFAVAMSISYGKPRVMLESYLSKWRYIKPATTGDDLKADGITPGPKYKEILQRLRAAWLDGEVRTIEEEKQLLETLLE
jgi:tRNA nucleotidyltransferase (CCA-adding enzyme)